jgi:hypothetical protein
MGVGVGWVWVRPDGVAWRRLRLRCAKWMARTVLRPGPMNQGQTTETGLAEGEQDLERNVAEFANRARDAIEEFVQEQPHAALGLAAAAGFIIGGGLTPRRLLRIGLAAGGPTFSRQVAAQVLRMANETFFDNHAEAEARAPAEKKPGKVRPVKKDREEG